jgi:hypothetical protein
MERAKPIAVHSGQQSVWEWASELAGRQFGAIARWQLLEAGLSPGLIRSWLRSGRLHAVIAGVYALGRRELTPEGLTAAALLHARRGAALTGISALWWQGLLHRRPRPTHVATPRRARSRPGVRVTHRSPLPRHLHRGLPVVSLAEAMLAATQHLSHNALRLVIARAEYAKLLDRPALEAAARSGRRGSSKLRAAIDAHLPALARCETPLERDFVLLCERERIPIPEPNTRVGRYRPDMLWRDAMLIVELDGEDAHTSPAQLAADARRQAWLEAQGFTVIRFTWDDVHHNPQRTAARVRSHLGL